LLEFKIVKQELLSYGYAIHVEKTETQRRDPHCGFTTSSVHDRRTRKVRDLGDFPSTGVLVRRGKALSVPELFPSVFRSFGIDQPNQHYTTTLHQSIL
jgi:hypothetical protein